MTVNRRDLLVGAAAAVTAGSAWALTPRQRVLLAAGRDLDKAIPTSFGPWHKAETDAVVAPRDESDLASKLYSQIVSRVYQRPDTGEYVMLLIAYGDTQNDLLQLHRPEVCYAAFGFRIFDSRPVSIPLAPGVTVPGRDLTAVAPSRTEYISYWTRIGEYLPVNGTEQRMMKLKTQFAGQIPDGVLVRVSSAQGDPATSFALNNRFIADLMQAIPAVARPALIGTQRAQALQAGPVRA